MWDPSSPTTDRTWALSSESSVLSTGPPGSPPNPTLESHAYLSLTYSKRLSSHNPERFNSSFLALHPDIPICAYYYPCLISGCMAFLAAKTTTANKHATSLCVKSYSAQSLLCLSCKALCVLHGAHSPSLSTLPSSHSLSFTLNLAAGEFGSLLSIKKKKKKKPAQLLVNLIYFLINCEEWGVFPPSISKPVHL